MKSINKLKKTRTALQSAENEPCGVGKQASFKDMTFDWLANQKSRERNCWLSEIIRMKFCVKANPCLLLWLKQYPRIFQLGVCWQDLPKYVNSFVEILEPLATERKTYHKPSRMHVYHLKFRLVFFTLGQFRSSSLFGHLSLPASVCLCVSITNTITCHLFRLESRHLDQNCKTP